MFSSRFISALLSLAAAPLLVSAAPTTVAIQERSVDSVAQATVAYYVALGQALLSSVSLGGKAPVCDLTKAVLPSSTLTPPSSSNVLSHIVLGQGTQNYTCASSTSADIPVAVGAVAILYDGNCIGSLYPSLLSAIPPVLLSYPAPAWPTVPSASSILGQTLRPLTVFSSFTTGAQAFPAPVSSIGKHFFNGAGVPTFSLGSAGSITAGKDESANSPLANTVPWLKLSAKSGYSSDFALVYRINTSGGVAPATCAGQASSFTVNYGSEYWIYK